MPLRTRSMDGRVVRYFCEQGLVRRRERKQDAVDEVAGGGKGSELGLLPQTRQQDSHGGCWLHGRDRAGRLRGMLLRMSPRPDGFRGCLLRTTMWEEGRAGAAAADETTGRPPENITFADMRDCVDDRVWDVVCG